MPLVGEEIIKANIHKIGLLGTAFTMEKDFYKGQLKKKHNLDVVIPSENNRRIVQNIIYDELCLGSITDSSKDEYLSIINNLKTKGAEAIFLGCTEITLLIKPQHTNIKLFDTTRIHTLKAVGLSLE